MSTATANGDAGLKGGPATNKQQLKPTAGGKALDNARKQAGSPVDGQNRSVAPMPSIRPGPGSTPLAKLPACPTPPPPHNFAHVCRGNIIPFRHALTLERMSFRRRPNADDAVQQKADPNTTESLDWHKPYHTAADKLSQSCQWLRQVPIKIGTTTAQRQRGFDC